MKDYIPFSRRIVPWLALGGLLLLAFMVVTPFLAPIAWAGVLAYASWPVASRIRRWCKNRDSLAASLSTALVALTLFMPLIWLVWLAQQELSNTYPALQAFLANPPPVPEAFRGLPWLGDWLVHQQATLVANPQGVSSVIKAWLAAHTNDLTTLAGGVGKNLVKLIFVIVILFFFYRDGVRIVRELRHVLERFIGAQVHDYARSWHDCACRGLRYFIDGFSARYGRWHRLLGSRISIASDVWCSDHDTGTHSIWHAFSLGGGRFLAIDARRDGRCHWRVDMGCGGG